MIDYRIQTILNLIEENWHDSGAWLGLVRNMRALLSSGDIQHSASQSNFSLKGVLLPGLSCQAAGGEFEQANAVAAAWLLYFNAAHIFDKVEDYELHQLAGMPQSPSVLVNSATGLVLSASNILWGLAGGKDASALMEVATDFFSSIMIICSGQDLDLSLPEISLENWWRIAEGKSGAVFELACSVGARLAGCTDSVLNMVSIFGSSLGLLIQLKDDIADLFSESYPISGRLSAQSARSLPVVYACSVLPPDETLRLKKSLETVEQSHQSAELALELIRDSGAALYLETQQSKLYAQAESALTRAFTNSIARSELEEMLKRYGGK